MNSRRLTASLLAAVLAFPQFQAHAAAALYPIPSNFGSIEETYTGRSNKTVLYIEDAHSSIEAQQNIAALIDSFVRQSGVKTVFEEGYEGAVPTDEFFGFIDSKADKEKVAFHFLKKLEIGGAEYAHILRAKDFKLIGADNLSIHRKNIRAYRLAARYQKQNAHNIAELSAEIDLLAKQHFPRPMKDWMRLRERLDRGELGLVDYLKRTWGISRPKEKTAYPAVTAMIEGRVEELDTKTLFQEIGRLEEGASNLLLETDIQKKIFEYQKGLALLRRMNALAVTPDEYDSVKSSLRKINTRAIAEFAARENRKSLVLSRIWEKNIRRAIQFYELARTRDLAIEKQLENFKQTSGEPVAVLVFGGFHRQRITEILKRKNISYQVVSPHITKPEPQQEAAYHRRMTHSLEASRPPSVYFYPDGAARVREVHRVFTGAARSELRTKPLSVLRLDDERLVTEISALNDAAAWEKTVGNHMYGDSLIHLGAWRRNDLTEFDFPPDRLIVERYKIVKALSERGIAVKIVVVPFPADSADKTGRPQHYQPRQFHYFFAVAKGKEAEARSFIKEVKEGLSLDSYVIPETAPDFHEPEWEMLRHVSIPASLEHQPPEMREAYLKEKAGDNQARLYLSNQNIAGDGTREIRAQMYLAGHEYAVWNHLVARGIPASIEIAPYPGNAHPERHMGFYDHDLFLVVPERFEGEARWFLSAVMDSVVMDASGRWIIPEGGIAGAARMTLDQSVSIETESEDYNDSTGGLSSHEYDYTPYTYSGFTGQSDLIAEELHSMGVYAYVWTYDSGNMNSPDRHFTHSVTTTYIKVRSYDQAFVRQYLDHRAEFLPVYQAAQRQNAYINARKLYENYLAYKKLKNASVPKAQDGDQVLISLRHVLTQAGREKEFQASFERPALPMFDEQGLRLVLAAQGIPEADIDTRFRSIFLTARRSNPSLNLKLLYETYDRFRREFAPSVLVLEEVDDYDEGEGLKHHPGKGHKSGEWESLRYDDDPDAVYLREQYGIKEIYAETREGVWEYLAGERHFWFVSAYKRYLVPPETDRDFVMLQRLAGDDIIRSILNQPIKFSDSSFQSIQDENELAGELKRLGYENVLPDKVFFSIFESSRRIDPAMNLPLLYETYLKNRSEKYKQYSPDGRFRIFTLVNYSKQYAGWDELDDFPGISGLEHGKWHVSQPSDDPQVHYFRDTLKMNDTYVVIRQGTFDELSLRHYWGIAEYYRELYVPVGDEAFVELYLSAGDSAMRRIFNMDNLESRVQLGTRVLGKGPYQPGMGGKEAGFLLFEKLGLPYPPGIALSPELVAAILKDNSASRLYQPLLEAKLKEIKAGLPVSVRSNPKQSMPGILTTVTDTTDLIGGIRTVADAWETDKARAYRLRENIADAYDLPVIIQQWVSGKSSDPEWSSLRAKNPALPLFAAGVFSTRDPNTGDDKITGRYLENANGEDLMTGGQKGESIEKLAEVSPEIYAQIVEAKKKLEAEAGPQEVEFVVNAGKLYFLQTRRLNFSPQAEIAFIREQLQAGKITEARALPRLEKLQSRLGARMLYRLKSEAAITVLARAEAATPGAQQGPLIWTADTARKLAEEKRPFILVSTPENQNEILPVLFESPFTALITSYGNEASHEAVLTRLSGIPSLINLNGVKFNYEERTLTLADNSVLREGDLAGIDGGSHTLFTGDEAVEPDRTVEDASYGISIPAFKEQFIAPYVLPDGSVRPEIVPRLEELNEAAQLEYDALAASTDKKAAFEANLKKHFLHELLLKQKVNRSELRSQPMLEAELEQTIRLRQEIIFTIGEKTLESLGKIDGHDVWLELLGLKMLNAKKIHIVIDAQEGESRGERAVELLTGHPNVYWGWDRAVRSGLPKNVPVIQFEKLSQSGLKAEELNERTARGVMLTFDVFAGAFMTALRYAQSPALLENLNRQNIKVVTSATALDMGLLEEFFRSYVVISQSA